MSIDDLDGLPGVVDKQLLAGAVGLAHHQIELAGPVTVVVAEPAVGEALRVGDAVLFPQQHQRHAGPAQLLVDYRPVGCGPHISRHRRWRRKQPSL
jgi:hypothetical protein